jgi:hypothetical protein
MKLTHEEFDRMRMQNNMVLIKPDRMFNDRIYFKDGTPFLIEPLRNDPSEERARCITGEVVRVPEVLRVGLDTEGMEWQTHMELKPGDQVLYSWMAVARALSHNKTVEVDGQVYLMINYGFIFLTKRSDGIRLINGYILVSPLKDEFKTDLIVPDMIKNRHSGKFGIVEHISEENAFYVVGDENIALDQRTTCVCTDPLTVYDRKISIGDRIIFDQNCDIPLETDMFETLDKTYFRMQRRNVICIIENTCF